MKSSFRFIIFLSVLIFFTGCKQKIQNLSTDDNIHFNCQYKNTSRTFTFYTPDNSSDNHSLIIMLHGYGSNAQSFQTQTNITNSALNRGYSIAFIDGIPDPDDKSSATGWNSGLNNSSKDDVGFLEALVLYLKNNFDFENLYAAGFINGGFMIHALAVKSDLFTGLVSVAGFLPQKTWSERPKKISSAFLQINGTKDDVVPMHANGSAKYNTNPAIEDVIEYYKTAYKNPELIQHIVIDEGRHSWPEKKFCGFEVNEVILDFFDSIKN